MNRVFAIASCITLWAVVPALARQSPQPGLALQGPPTVAAPIATPQVQPPPSTGQRAQPAPAMAATPAPSGRSLQAFAVTLLIADMQPGGAGDDVPAAARKAVADLKDFLPYKSYRLVDAQWIRSSEGAWAESRIKALEQQEYALRLRGIPVPGGLGVAFTLRDASAAASPNPASGSATAELMVRRQQLQSQIAELQKKVEMGVSGASALQPLEHDLQTVTMQLEQVKDRQAQERSAGQKTAASGGTIMDANFRMELDETVVVGTSRVKGDKALIALLTAVGTKQPSERREP